MEICNTAVPDGSDSPNDEATELLFDTRAPFNKWLLSLAASQPESGDQASKPDATHGESPGSEREVTFDGVLRVDGLLRGSVRSPEGILVMTNQGRIEADVDVRVALIDGYVEGDIRASDHVVLNRHAKVAGNIYTPSLSIKDGAVFEGSSFVIGETVSEVREVPGSEPLKATTVNV